MKRSEAYEIGRAFAAMNGPDVPRDSSLEDWAKSTLKINGIRPDEAALRDFISGVESVIGKGRIVDVSVKAVTEALESGKPDEHYQMTNARNAARKIGRESAGG